MVTAISLLHVEQERVNNVATHLAELEGISEVYSVAGQYDLVVILRAGSNEELQELVTNHMLQVEGITDSETLLAFRAYSQHDLESMFSLGME